MAKTIEHRKLTNTLELSQCTDGFWLYDKTRGMNLAMRAESAEGALVEAIEYYQCRLLELESEHTILRSRVDSFVALFVEED